MSYNHLKVEEKWRKYYQEHNIFYCDTSDFSKPKFYALDMFPYPSGQGLHVGHPEGYTASDIVARMKRMQGYNVLHPMGFDSFGLPAEQYAIKTGNHPEGFTLENIENFKRQLNMLGFSFDWSKEVSTCDPSFYKWTQWIFIELLKAGLAKIVDMPVNWCEELGTVLANDEVVDGKSERGGYPVVRKNMKQWVLDIPKYAERLLDGLNKLDWPISTKEIQRNWIGKSLGASIIFKVADSKETFEVFTTRADTLFGATYCVLSPEHKLVNKIASEDKLEEIKAYQEFASKKSDLERTDTNKEKTGCFIGAYAINPVNNKRIPIYISDYVLASYGVGAIMAVPAHDTRDYEFAKKFNIDIIPVIEGGDISKEAYTGDGKHINSDFLNGLSKADAIKAMIDFLSKKGIGKEKVNYKMREWVFARQRYWGEPIPVVFVGDKIVPLSKEELPLVLPKLDDYGRCMDGSAPLNKATDWVNYNHNGIVGKRETNTMPGSAGSSWYFFRYIDPKNDKEFANYKLLKHWMPVDLYIGGPEHAVGHLLYSRFWTKFLFDKKYSPVDEPFQRLFHQGMVLGENGEKMSKSRGNVVNPDDVVKEYGADALRLFEMFAGPLEESFPWSTNGLIASRKFIERVYRIYTEEEMLNKVSDTNSGELDLIFNQTVKKVTLDFEALQINTAIAQMMIFINSVYKAKSLYRPYLIDFLKMFSCICPFVSEELYELFTHKSPIDYESWPTYDESKLTINEVNIAVSVNGKLRATLLMKVDASEEELKNVALKLENVQKHLEGKTIRKVIVVKNKIVNIVAN